MSLTEWLNTTLGNTVAYPWLQGREAYKGWYSSWSLLHFHSCYANCVIAYPSAVQYSLVYTINTKSLLLSHQVTELLTELCQSYPPGNSLTNF